LSMLIAAFAITAALLAAVIWDKKARKRLCQSLRWLFTYLSGAPLDGTHHTDATFLRHPTKIKHPRGRLIPHKWHWRPGWQRAAVRVAGPVAVAGTAAGVLLASEAALIAAAVFAAAALARAGLLAYRKVRRWLPSR
jgi:hypothetical protein